MNAMSTGPAVQKACCKRCIHLRFAPFQARRTGCYHPDLMEAKQKDRVLDEQQIPGDPEVLNRHGDCTKFEPRPAKPPLWQRLWS